MLSSNGRLLFLYLLTQPEINLIGIFEVDVEVCRLKSKLNKEEFDKTIKEIVKMVRWDEGTSMVWVVNRFKLYPTKSSTVIKGAINELNQITHKFRDEFVKKYKDILHPYLAELERYEIKENILTEEQVMSLKKINYNRESIKKFYLNRGYQEEKIDKILQRIFIGS